MNGTDFKGIAHEADSILTGSEKTFQRTGGESFGADLYLKRAQLYNLKRKAEVAQLVEQLIRNQQVVGSSPTFGSILFDNLHGLRLAL